MPHNFWTKSYKICHCVAKSSFFSVADCKDKCVFKFQTDLDNSQKKQLPPVQNNFSFHRYFLRFILSNAKKHYHFYCQLGYGISNSWIQNQQYFSKKKSWGVLCIELLPLISKFYFSKSIFTITNPSIVSIKVILF